jgi:hypothetical protein
MPNEREQAFTKYADQPSDRLTDAGTFRRAQERGQPTFTVVAQDKSAPSVVCEWIKQNIETAPPAKLYEALSRAIQMREFHFRKSAD